MLQAVLGKKGNGEGPEYTYRIRPNYHTVCLGFAKLLEKLAVKYPPDKVSIIKDKRCLHKMIIK